MSNKPIIRRPVVASQFYEGTEQHLIQQIKRCFEHGLGPGEIPEVSLEGKRSILGLVSPHAGYMFSGPIAAHGFHELAGDGLPDVVVIIGPNHSGRGSGLAISSQGHWKTPLGNVKIDRDTARKILGQSRLVVEDDKAHEGEHSVEVQLPFLQYLYHEKLQFVPICMLDQGEHASLELGEALSIALCDKNALIVASTDFSHYEPQNCARAQDRKALDVILAMSEPNELAKVVHRYGISMCGYGPVMAMLRATRAFGARKAKLLKYATSGDISGMYDQVVGYASIMVTK